MKSKTFGILILAGVTVALIVGGIWLLFAHIRSENEKIAEQKNVIDTTLNQQQRVLSMQALAQDTEEDRALLDSYFVGSEDVVSFLETLESLGDITGASVDISSVNIDSGIVLTDEQKSRQSRGEEIQLPPVTAENLQIRMRAEGTWEEVVHVLALLEALPFYITHDEVVIEELRGEVEAWRGRYEFHVKKLP